MKKLLAPLTWGRRSLLVMSFLLVSFAMMAQSADGYQSETDSLKGFWKLQTDYTTRRTTIRFFNAQRELVYQETMPGKYVKLTRRNIRLFDETLARLTNSQLLVSQVRSYDLLASSNVHFTRHDAAEPAETRLRREEPLAYPLLESSKTFKAYPMVSNEGRLRITFANPEQRKVFIELTDDSDNVRYYAELSRMAAYNRHLNIRQLMDGTYHLRMRGPQRERLLYRLTVNQNAHKYELKPLTDATF